MNFCEKCGSRYVPKKEKGKIFLICKKCGHCTDNSKPVEIKEKIKKDPLKDDVVVISEKVDSLPKTRAICRKCGHKEAMWRVQQMRSSDEPPTIFFICTKCNHSWRKY